MLEKSARVAALDYLGTIASRLRKDSLAASVDQNAVNDIITMVCRECSVSLLAFLVLASRLHFSGGSCLKDKREA